MAPDHRKPGSLPPRQHTGETPHSAHAIDAPGTAHPASTRSSPAVTSLEPRRATAEPAVRAQPRHSSAKTESSTGERVSLAKPRVAVSSGTPIRSASAGSGAATSAAALGTSRESKGTLSPAGTSYRIVQSRTAKASALRSPALAGGAFDGSASRAKSIESGSRMASGAATTPSQPAKAAARSGLLVSAPISSATLPRKGANVSVDPDRLRPAGKTPFGKASPTPRELTGVRSGAVTPPAAPTDEASRRSTVPAPDGKLPAAALSEPGLSPNGAPVSDKASPGGSDPIPRAPKVPTALESLGPNATSAAGWAPPDPQSRPYGDLHTDDKTRSYSLETMGILLGEAQEGGPSSPVETPPPSGDLTRVYGDVLGDAGVSIPAVGDLGPGPDDLTRVYEAPPGALDETTPIRVRVGEPAPQLGAHRYREVLYLLLGLMIGGLIAAWLYRDALRAQLLTSPAGTALPQRKPGREPGLVAEPKATTEISVSIRVEPASAILTLDGEPVSNPFETRRKADKALHELVARAPGYEVLRRSIPLERDVIVMFSLSRSPQADAAPGAASGAENTEAAPGDAQRASE